MPGERDNETSLSVTREENKRGGPIRAFEVDFSLHELQNLICIKQQALRAAGKRYSRVNVPEKRTFCLLTQTASRVRRTVTPSVDLLHGSPQVVAHLSNGRLLRTSQEGGHPVQLEGRWDAIHLCFFDNLVVFSFYGTSLSLVGFSRVFLRLVKRNKRTLEQRA